jgi:hypothetical protein
MSDDLTTDLVSHRSQSVVVSVLRWIAVLPAAAGAFVGIQLLIILMNAMTEPRWSDWWLQLVNSAASSYCFVYAGARTAPSYQFVVGIVLATLFGIFIVVIATAGFFIKTSDPLWWLLLAGIISLVAAIVAVVRLSDDR